jgi:hypothetical protein
MNVGFMKIKPSMSLKRCRGQDGQEQQGVTQEGEDYEHPLGHQAVPG